MAVTVHLTAFGDEQLDADFAIVLGGKDALTQRASRQTFDRRQLSLGYLLSSRQASTTIGFSLAIVFVMSATFAVIHNPRKGASSTSPAINPPLQITSEELAITNNNLSAKYASTPTIETNTLRSTAAPHARNKAYSIARDDKLRNESESHEHIHTFDRRLSRKSVALLAGHPKSIDRFDINPPPNVDMPDDVVPRVAHISQSGAPAVMTSTASTLEAVPDVDASAARARRDSITALRSLRRQW